MELSGLPSEVGARLQAAQLNQKPERPDAAAELEKLFATFVVKEMRRGLPQGFFGKGAGSDIFEGWLQEHLGSSLAESGALDLAGSIKVSLQSKQDSAEQRAPENNEKEAAQGTQRPVERGIDPR